MKYFFLVFILLFSFSSNASVMALWSDESVNIVIQGQDSDASKLYNVMDVDPVVIDSNGILQKEIEHIDSDGNIVFNLKCVSSALSSAKSCTLKINTHPWTYLSKRSELALIRINGNDNKDLLSKFIEVITIETVIFRSEGNQLSMTLKFDENDNPLLFRVAYKESGLTI